MPLFLLLLSVAGAVQAATFEVGPGKPYSSAGAVPWESLQPGDLVLIHWRSTPYKEKWVLCRQGTAANPITVRGVPGPNGELPVFDGNGATTRTALNYWNEVRGLLKIGGANLPADTTPQYITIENLEFRGARPPYTFTAANGSTQSYVNNAAAIYIEKGEHITIRNCILDDSGNGLFAGSGNPTQPSRNFLIEGNSIYGNGNQGSAYEHNNYTEVLGIVFQYNHFGPLRSGASGNNLKDRSAGLVVRYNWIEGGNRQLDLVDAEDSSAIASDPGYRSTFVYGNILIEPDGDGNRQIVHYGGDSGTTTIYRKGALYLYNNTIVSTRMDRTTLLRLSTNDETCDCRNNIVYVSAAGNTLSLLDQSGTLNLSHNWFKSGRVSTFGTLDGTIHDDGSSVTGSSPGFLDEAGQDFHLTAGSAAKNGATALAAAALPANAVIRQYLKHQSSEVRPSDAAPDIGAYEYASTAASRCDINTDASVNVVDLQLLVNIAIGAASLPGVGDLNRDGRVDVIDVQTLVNVLLGAAACPL
ncbi:MAG: right-handed parallel beta-helix repeat-containing protein [Bryobacterales bacterium]|nr:right-handed parallel beta-helix repeat-containing protein [Bryobacterales bacterium]